MSGLCGLVRLDGGPVEEGALSSMASAAAHRGPDGGGRVLLGQAGFVWQALRVTPEDAAEVQPLRVGGLVVVADARLDDRAGLRQRLGSGAPGRDAPDSVLIAAAWQRWGPRAPERLLGDFAVVVYDVDRRVLWAFRDPMGMRPLYYRVEPGRRVLLASEVKQILAAPGVETRVHEPAIAAHLVGPVVPPTWTFDTGVEAVGPGELVRVDERGRVEREAWWSLDPEERIVYRDPREYVAHFQELFLAAVADRLRSAKPVGVLLSGGLDSGSVAASAGWLREHGRAAQDDLRTLSWGFRELGSCDERTISDLTCRRYSLPSTVVWGDRGYPLAEQGGRDPDRDDPYLGTYQALTEDTLRTAHEEGLGLLLPGTRGDYLVGDRVTDELGMLRAGHPLAALTDLRAHGGAAALRSVRDGARRAVGRGRGVTPVSPPAWLDEATAARTAVADTLAAAWARPAWGDQARAARAATVRSWAGQRAVDHEERSWARHGLGYADPWSDQRLVRFVTAVPQWRLQRRTARKLLVREAMAGILPDPVRHRPSGNEFAALYDRGMRDCSADLVHELLREPLLARAGWVDGAGLREEYRRYREGEPGGHPPWWALVAELWLRRWWT